jgi:hypothetical protein
MRRILDLDGTDIFIKNLKSNTLRWRHLKMIYLQPVHESGGDTLSTVRLERSTL